MKFIVWLADDPGVVGVGSLGWVCLCVCVCVYPGHFASGLVECTLCGQGFL